MTLQLTPRRTLTLSAILTLLAVLFALYFVDLNGAGLISTDEPRYADIGRAMARTGDLITPRLSGQPWFEKPPLLYWLIALGFKAGLGPETAPRLPIALLSAGFLGFFYNRLRRLWDARIAGLSTALLATSAAWVALSGIAITDIPLAVFFSAAVLLSLDGDERAETPRRLTLAAVCLGLAVLAKSLVAPVLFIPVLAADSRRLREWLAPGPILAFFAIALPWYLLCYLKNGGDFLYILFIQQQFGRFATAERQHEQKWWFYGPALLMAVYPWFPLLATVSRQWSDRRIRILLSVVVFGFLFFSASLNKLPTYLTPLVPPVCILMGIGLARLAKPERAMVLPLALLGLLPVVNRALPIAMSRGIHAVSIPWLQVALYCGALGAASLVMAMLLKQKTVYAAFLLTAVAFLSLKLAAFPALDRSATARPLWLAQHPACTDPSQRAVAYGLNYYAERLLPQCAVLDPSPTRVVR